MRKSIFIFCSILFLFMSCNNDNFETTHNENASGNILRFSYLGNTYSSSYKLLNDSLLVLENPELNELYQKIQEIPELATYMKNDGSFEFYDNYNELEHALNIQLLENSSTKSSVQVGQIYLYEHAGKGGRYLSFPIYDYGLNVPDIGVYQFNDMLSSFYAKANEYNRYTVTLFRDQNYGGRSISFLIPLELYIDNLKAYRMSKAGSWNDNMTSFRITKNY